MTLHSCHRIDHAGYVESVGREIAAMAAVLEGADLSAPVPTCPGWTLADLAEHAGTIHRWVTGIVRDLSPTRPDRGSIDFGVPGDRSALPAWLAEGAPPLAEALGAADPDAEVWVWGADKHVRFWARRMLHETAVHRADAELAVDREPTIDAGAAIDGVDELLDNLPFAAYFAPAVDHLRGQGETMHLHATDADGEWIIRLEPDAFRWEHGHEKATVAVRGSAADLLLLLYGRRAPDGDGDRGSRFEIFGERALLERWLTNSSL